MVEHDLNKIVELIKEHKISVNELERFIERLPLTEVDGVEFLDFLDEAGKYIDKVNNGEIKVKKEIVHHSGRNAKEIMKSVEERSLDLGLDIYIYNNPGGGKSVSFKYEEISRKYLISIINKVYELDGLELEFRRIHSKSEEYFNINILPNDLSIEEYNDKLISTFELISEALDTPKEKELPKEIDKIRYIINNDFYIRANDLTLGINMDNNNRVCYVLSDGSIGFEEYAQKLKFKSKRKNDLGMYEITEPLNKDDVKYSEEEFTRTYINLNHDLEVAQIIDFIETSPSRDFDEIEILIPEDSLDKRVVLLKKNGDLDREIVFKRGQKFDNEVLPSIVNSFLSTNPDSIDKITTTETEVSMLIESSNSSILKLIGYSKSDVSYLLNTISKKKNILIRINRNIKEEKKPVDRKAFIEITVLLVMFILFIALVSFVALSA